MQLVRKKKSNKEEEHCNNHNDNRVRSGVLQQGTELAFIGTVSFNERPDAHSTTETDESRYTLHGDERALAVGVPGRGHLPLSERADRKLVQRQLGTQLPTQTAGDRTGDDTIWAPALASTVLSAKEQAQRILTACAKAVKECRTLLNVVETTYTTRHIQYFLRNQQEIVHSLTKVVFFALESNC